MTDPTQPVIPVVPAKREPSKGAKIAGGIIAAVIAIGCIGGAIAVFSGGSTPTPAKPKTTAAKVAAWQANGGTDDMNAIAKDLNDMGTAGGKTDFAAMDVACGALADDVVTAENYDPIPAASVQKPWAAALKELAKAAENCTAGIQGGSASQIGKASDEINTGDGDIQKAVAALGSISS